jgi:hypothetical protein
MNEVTLSVPGYDSQRGVVAAAEGGFTVVGCGTAPLKSSVQPGCDGSGSRKAVVLSRGKPPSPSPPGYPLPGIVRKVREELNT